MRVQWDHKLREATVVVLDENLHVDVVLACLKQIGVVCYVRIRILNLSPDTKFVMTRQTDPRNLFATHTAFSALNVESGEDTAEEEIAEEPSDRYF